MMRAPASRFVRALVGVAALLLVGAWLSLSACSLKPPFECSDGGCYGEPMPDAADGGPVG